MPLEPAETRPRSSFSWVESCFSKEQSAKLTPTKRFYGGTENFGETPVQTRDHIPVNTMWKSHNHTLSPHW